MVEFHGLAGAGLPLKMLYIKLKRKILKGHKIGFIRLKMAAVLLKTQKLNLRHGYSSYYKLQNTKLCGIFVSILSTISFLI